MTDTPSSGAPEAAAGSNRLAILLAMAMFVLVVDTSLMNVSIAAVVRDLDTTVSSIQSAIALEALVSAAFILIGSKVGDLFGRKRAYVLGLLGYAVGALAMAFAQGLTAIIIFWAIVGGLGASLLLPAMQSLIHGNFDGAAQRKAYALVGGGFDRRGRWTAPRGIHHHLPVVARRVPARGRDHRHRAVRHQTRARRAVHRVPPG
jgi:MFS family permease